MQELSLRLKNYISEVHNKKEQLWFASDLDGTLLGDNSQLIVGHKEKLQTLLEAGMLLTVASARSLQAIRNVLGRLAIPLPVVQKNGAVVSDFLSGERLSFSPIPQQICKRVFEMIDANGITMVVATGLLTCDEDDLFSLPKELKNALQEDAKLLKNEEFTTLQHLEGARIQKFFNSAVENKDKRLRLCSDFTKLYTHDIMGITVFHKPEVLENFVKLMKEEEITNVLNIYPMYIGDDGLQRMTIQAKSCSKSNALQFVARRSQLKLENCIAFGDNSNDSEMLQDAGFGIATSNGKEEVKALANEVIGPNTSGSVVEILQRCFAFSAHLQ